jgi:hypothetical protein
MIREQQAGSAVGVFSAVVPASYDLRRNIANMPKRMPNDQLATPHRKVSRELRPKLATTH